MSDCSNTITKAKPTYLHPVNLPVLKTLFPLTYSKSISGAHVFQTPNEIHIPNLKIANSSWKNIAEKEQKFKMSFKDIANNVKTSNLIYKSQTDFLHAQSPDNSVSYQSIMPNSIKTWTFALFPNILSFISIFISIYLYCKSRRALSFMPLATNIPKATAIIVNTNYSRLIIRPAAPVEHYDDILTPIPELSESKLIIDLSFVILAGIISIHLLLYIARLIFAKTYRHQRHHTFACNTSLFLELSDHSSCVLLEVVQWPSCPSNLDLHGLEPPCEFTFNEKFFKGTLNLIWSTSNVSRLSDGRQFELPKTLKVLGKTKRKLNIILKHNYTAHLNISHGNLSFPLSYKMISSNNETQLMSPTTSTQMSDNLYPNLNLV